MANRTKGPEPALERRRRHRWAHPWVVGMVAFVIFNLNFRNTASYDSLAASLIPFHLLRGQGLTLDRFGSALGVDIGYSMVRAADGHWVSFYPIVTPLLATPFYLPTLLSPRLGIDDPRTWTVSRRVFEKFSASALAAIAVGLMVVLLRRHVRAPVAAALGLLYALGTPLWSIGSQGLWPHAPAQLLLIAGLLLAGDFEASTSWWRAALVGVASGLLVANRPQMLPFAIALCGLALWRLRARAIWTALGGGLVTALFVAHNLHYFGNLLGGYGLDTLPNGSRLEWFAPTPERIVTLLFGNRGLFVFCPFLLLVGVVAWRARRRLPIAAIAWALAFLAFLLLHASFSSLGGGTTYGPRYLGDAVPLFFLALVAGWRTLARPARIALWAAGAFAIALQVLGAFYFTGIRAGEESNGLWTIRASGPVLSWIAGPASPEFAHWVLPKHMRGPVERRIAPRWRRLPALRARPSALVTCEIEATNGTTVAISSLGGYGAMHGVRWLATWRHEASGEIVANHYWMAFSWPRGEVRRWNLTLFAPRRPGFHEVTMEPAQFDGTRWVPFSEAGSPPLRARIELQ